MGRAHLEAVSRGAEAPALFLTKHTPPRLRRLTGAGFFVHPVIRLFVKSPLVQGKEILLPILPAVNAFLRIFRAGFPAGAVPHGPIHLASRNERGRCRTPQG